MDRNRAFSLVLGLVTIVLMVVVGYSMNHKWIPAELGLTALGALSAFLMMLRSPQEKPFPRPATSDPSPFTTLKNPDGTVADLPKGTVGDPPGTIPPGTGTPLVFLLIGIGCVVALTPFALCSCGPTKDVIAPNPQASDCNSRKAQAEAQCNLDAKTALEAQACKAKLREHRCSDDGGV